MPLWRVSLACAPQMPLAEMMRRYDACGTKEVTIGMCNSEYHRVSMRELDRAVRVLHKKLAMIFKNAAEAFIFFDPDASYTISFAELKRGIFRLNLQVSQT
jgi:hypothetical protein